VGGFFNGSNLSIFHHIIHTLKNLTLENGLIYGMFYLPKGSTLTCNYPILYGQ
jgi:hypothetical protein